MLLDAGMEIEDDKAALKAISDNAQDEKERIQMLLLFKSMLPDKRRDFWHGLSPKDLVGMLRSLLGSGGLGMCSKVRRNTYATLGYSSQPVPSLPCLTNHPLHAPSPCHDDLLPSLWTT